VTAGEPTIDEYRRAADLRAALRQFVRHSEQIARAHGLTPRQYVLLLMIKGAPDGSEQSTVTELAERLQLMQSTVTELVARAESAGLVRRSQSADDGRVILLRLTERAEEIMRHAVAEHRDERRQLAQLVADLQEERDGP
jgi:DNA-binding MarR family transcriptional regulator